jgi:hypothetical protein
MPARLINAIGEDSEYQNDSDSSEDESGIHMAARAHAAELQLDIENEETDASEWPRQMSAKPTKAGKDSDITEVLRVLVEKDELRDNKLFMQ